jgi:hypothetical protein
MRTSIRISTLFAALLLALALAAAPAGANASDDRIVGDCQHSQTGALSGSYTKQELRHAKNNLPGDVLEYSGCYDAIRQALLASAGGDGDSDGSAPRGSGGTGGIGGTGGSGSSGGTTAGVGGGTALPATPHIGTRAPVQVAGSPVEPGALPVIGKDAHKLPAALIVLLTLLGIATLVPAALMIGRRVVTHRRV